MSTRVSFVASLVLAAVIALGFLWSDPVIAGETPGFKPCLMKPVDESSLDPSFAAWWRDLRIAIERKDVGFLRAHLATDLKWSFGDEHGRDAFFKRFGLDSTPAESEVWAILAEILRLGGTFSNASRTSFVAPYVFSTWPDDYDSFAYLAVVGANVVLRAKPDSRAEKVGELSHELVRDLPNMKMDPPSETINGETHPWKHVLTSAGKAGYVWGKYLRCPVDWRMSVERSGASWTIHLFIAGD